MYHNSHHKIIFPEWRLLAEAFAAEFYHRLLVIKGTDSLSMRCGAAVAVDLLQQHYEFNFGVHLVILAMQLNAGTDSLAPDLILPMHYMLMYMVFRDLSWRKEAQDDQ